METYYSPVTHDVHRRIAWPLIASGLWLRLGFVGASGSVAAMIAMFTGDTGPWAALPLAIAGAALAAYSWRRALAVLERADTPAGAGRESTKVLAPGAAGESLRLTLSPLHR